MPFRFPSPVARALLALGVLAGCAGTSGPGPADYAAIVAAPDRSGAARKPDVIVFELGDGILGAYGVEAILRDEAVRKALTCVVLCANDPVTASASRRASTASRRRRWAGRSRLPASGSSRAASSCAARRTRAT